MPKHFTDDEVMGLDPRFVRRLDWARDKAGVPFIITSGYRPPDQNVAAGGVENSAHTRGLAVDLKCVGSLERFSMLTGLLAVGFCRLGVYDRHVHVDMDDSLPQEVIWWGKSK